MRKAIPNLAVLLAVVVVVICAAAPVDEAKLPHGRVCLAALPEPAKGQRTPWRTEGERGLTNYSVQIDERQPIPLSTSKSQWVDGLDLATNHSVAIRIDGKTVESFVFDFGQFEFRKVNKPDVCLFMNSLYFTWQLWRVERTGEWCECWSNEPRN